jgi:hypothetical protein
MVSQCGQGIASCNAISIGCGGVDAAGDAFEAIGGGELWHNDTDVTRLALLTQWIGSDKHMLIGCLTEVCAN